MTRRNYAFPLATDLILEHLAEFGPATIQDLIVETGKGRDAVRKAINKLHADKRIFIKAWPYIGMHRSRQWALRTGGQPDAPKPEPRPLSELQAEWARRNKTLLKARRSINAARGNPFAMLIR